MKIQTVLGKEIGHTVPVDLLKIILKQGPTAFGFAVQCTDDAGNLDLSVTREAGAPKIEELVEFMNNAKDYRALMTFGMLGTKFNNDDILPLILNDGDDKPFMAIGLEGDFPKFSNIEGGRTDEFNLANSIIIPSLLEICELTDGDLSKIVAALGRDSFNNNFLAQIGHRGVMTILPVEGEFLHFGKNDIGETYDWGFTSNKFSFGDAVQEPEAKAEEPKKKFSFGKKTAATLPKDVATPDTAPRSSVPAVSSSKGNTDIADTKAKGKVVPLPSWVHKNEDIKSFYEMVYGQRPQNWKKRIPVIVPEETAIPSNIEELHAWAAERAKGRITEASAAAVKPAATATAAPAPKSGSEIAAAREDADLPIIPAKDMEKLLDFVAKNTDSKTTTMMTPSEIQALEKKWGTFSTSIASSPLEMYHWPISVWFALAKQEPRALVLAMREYANLWYGTLKAEDLVGTSVTKTPAATTTVTKTGDTTKVESVSNEAAPAPRRGWFTKKAA